MTLFVDSLLESNGAHWSQIDEQVSGIEVWSAFLYLVETKVLQPRDAMDVCVLTKVSTPSVLCRYIYVRTSFRLPCIVRLQRRRRNVRSRDVNTLLFITKPSNLQPHRSPP